MTGRSRGVTDPLGTETGRFLFTVLKTVSGLETQRHR